MFQQKLYKLSQLTYSRYRLLAILASTAIGIFAFTRLSLFSFSPLLAPGLSIETVLKVFSIGFIYDLSFLLYTLIPATLYFLLIPNRFWQTRWNRNLVHFLFLMTLFSLFCIAISEFLFWEEFQSRFNFIAVDYLIYRQEVTENIAESYPVAAFLLSAFVIAFRLYKKISPKIEFIFHRKEPFLQRFIIALIFLCSATVSFFFLDQNLAYSSENNYQNELSANGPYQFIAAFKNNELNYYQFYSFLDNQKASQVLMRNMGIKNEDGLFNINRMVMASGEEKRLNVILIMVESLSAKYLGIFGNEDQLTPFLDKLSESSLLFTRLYATGTRTDRGLEAVTLSIPPTPGRSIVKRIGRESNMHSLGNILKSKGYDSKFIYGGRGYFDNMNAFFSGNGYEVIDQTKTPESEIGFKNAWGMADEYLFNQAIKAADDDYSHQKPFFFHIMTTSNHRPYTYPDDRVPLKKSRYGAIQYTDWAIQHFIEDSKTKPWFENTIFVIVADHTASSAGKSTLSLEGYHIPMLIYAPKHISPKKVDTLCSQIDIAPTLLSLLNMSYSSYFFGQDILSTPKNKARALIANYQHLGYYEDGYLAILSPRKKALLQKNPENLEQPITAEGKKVDPFIERAISYYQGASYIYQNHLNKWNP